MDINITWREAVLLAALGIVLILIASLIVPLWRRADTRSTPDADEGEHRRLSARVDHLEARLAALETRLASTSSDNQDAPEPTLYETAQALLDRGLDVAEVAHRLGLSTAEVDLLAAMRRES
jgi:cell division protein FtsB